MGDIDPQFPRYVLTANTGPQLKIDGPRVEEGAEVEVRLICKVGVIPSDAALAKGIAIALRVTDFAGPRVLAEDGVSLLGDDQTLDPRHAVVLAATIHDALHPEHPWDDLPAVRQVQLAGLFTRMAADGVLAPGTAVTEAVR